MKQCKKCLKTLPLEGFYKNKGMTDGHLNQCKDCDNAYQSKRRKEEPEKLRAYELSRRSDPVRRERVKVYTETTKLRYPERRAAHVKLGNAVRDGTVLKQPCFMCGETKVEAHHPDYDSPLDVVWLCQPHHKELHKEMPQ